jgi:hypothetical protein
VHLVVNPNEDFQQRVDVLLSWLQHRGQHVTKLAVQLLPCSSQPSLSSCHVQLPTLLPCPQLRELQLERCRMRLSGSPPMDASTEQHSPQGLLHACTALTRLSLTRCALEQPTRQLSLSAGIAATLQRLCLSHVHAAGLLPSSSFSGVSVHIPDTLLLQLRILTALHLSSQTITLSDLEDADFDDDQHDGSMQQMAVSLRNLQELSLQHVPLQDAQGQCQGVCDAVANITPSLPQVLGL